MVPNKILYANPTRTELEISFGNVSKKRAGGRLSKQTVNIWMTINKYIFISEKSIYVLSTKIICRAKNNALKTSRRQAQNQTKEYKNLEREYDNLFDTIASYTN